MRHLPNLVLFLMFATCQSHASAAVLFDFESDDDLKHWTLNDPKNSLKLSSDFVTTGKHSAVLETPEWKPGMFEWPIWETTNPPIGDWSKFDRLMIDFTNTSGMAALVRGRASDEPTSKKPSWMWPAWSFTIEPRSHLRAIISLDTFLGSAIDRGKVTRFMLYTARATPNYRVHLDNVTLLAPGEEPSPLPAKYVQQVAELRLKRHSFQKARDAMDSARQAVEKLDGNEIRVWADASLKSLTDSLNALMSEGTVASLRIERINEIGEESDLLAQRAARLSTLLELRSAFSQFSTVTQYAVGFASSMDKVLPRDMPLTNVVAETMREISVARNESEGVQVVVAPFDQKLENVKIEVGEFRAENGDVLPASAVDVRVVGYVKTKRPAYDVSYVGWWPDPLIDFLEQVNIEPGDAQAFWVRVRPAKDARPGMYEATVRITASNASPTELKLRVRVRDFEVPDASPLPIATNEPDDYEFKKYGGEPWETFKLKLADFLADYYIDYDEIYRKGSPDFEILRHLRDQERLRAFNLATLADRVFVPDLTEDQYQAALAELISQIQPGYDQAKAEGMLQYAYLYGMDEVPPEAYPILKRMTDDVKKRFPEVPIMTTAQDFTYGQASGADSVDAWVPIIHEYKPELAKEARARGKKVWWYTCQSPMHPYPNLFTEYPAIDMRMLMGALTIKYQPDGFLYYCTFRDLIYDDPPRKAVDSGPFTDWNPRAFVEPFNGEGYLFYPGPNGRPLSSIRLENFRDGLEDYAYWVTLNEMVQNASSDTDRAWLSQAQQALKVPAGVAKSAHEFTSDAEVLYAWRQTLADLIEQNKRQTVP